MAERFQFPYSAAQALRDLVGRKKAPKDHSNVEFPKFRKPNSAIFQEMESGLSDHDFCRSILTSWLAINQYITSADWMDIPSQNEATLIVFNGEGLCEIVGVRFRWRKAAKIFLVDAKVWNEKGVSRWDEQARNPSKPSQKRSEFQPEITETIPESVKQTLLKEQALFAEQPFEFLNRLSAYHYNGQWLDIPRADGGMTLSLVHALEVSIWLVNVKNDS